MIAMLAKQSSASRASCYHAPWVLCPCVRVHSHTRYRACETQVLVRLRQILRVTRIFRLMRVLKLFQQYLVSAPQSSWPYNSSLLAAPYPLGP